MYNICMKLTGQVLLLDFNNVYWKRDPEKFVELYRICHGSRGNYSRILNSGDNEKKQLPAWVNECVGNVLNDDFYKLSTKLCWIFNGYVDFPKCVLCGKPLDHINVSATGTYPQYCSKKCRYDDPALKKRTESTSLRLYGHRCSLHGKDQKKKTKETWDKTYHTDNPAKSAAIRTKISETKKSFSNAKKALIESEKQKTCMLHFGVPHQFMAKGVQEKCEQTMLRKHGVTNFAQSQEYRDLMSDPKMNASRMRKQFETKKKNGTLNTSSSEKECMKALQDVFGLEDVVTQYMSAEYPFHCDFFVKSLDLYIELNGHWSHGGHFFDANNDDDMQTVMKWKAKNTEYYDVCAYVWTDLDIRKARCAIEHQLHYLVFWSKNELLAWVSHFSK